MTTKERKRPKPYVRYSDKLWRLICERIAQGGTVVDACQGPNVCTSTAAYQWIGRFRTSSDPINKARYAIYRDAIEARARLRADDASSSS